MDNNKANAAAYSSGRHSQSVNLGNKGGSGLEIGQRLSESLDEVDRRINEAQRLMELEPLVASTNLIEALRIIRSLPQIVRDIEVLDTTHMNRFQALLTDMAEVINVARRY